MSSLEKAVETQLRNIEARSGKTLAEVTEIIRQSGLTKHGEIRTMLMGALGLGYGDANALVHAASRSDAARVAGEQGLATGDVVSELYTGAKAHLRPIHDRLSEAIEAFGAFETLPKKGYVSLRRKKQFAMIGPATNTRVEVGLNVKGLDAHPRLIEQAPGGMCSYKVRVSDPAEVDAELIGWLRLAYDGAG